MPDIDNRIVRMEFDNKQFEAGVSKTLASLEDLKKKMDFGESAKSISNIDKAVNNIDFSALNNAMGAIEKRFSVWGTVVDQTIRNITSKVQSAAKNIVKSLTIDQVSTGWNKYESILTSTRTMMSATGNTADEVGESLKKLMWFADETSYSYEQMASAMGKFAAKGWSAEDSRQVAQGIATWGAQAGQSAEAVNRVLYNLAQVSDYVKKQDWMSVINANMNNKQFMDLVASIAEQEGVLKKVGDSWETYGKKVKKVGVTVNSETFGESLTQGGWFTIDILKKVTKEYNRYAEAVYDYTKANHVSTQQAMDDLSKTEEWATGLGKTIREAFEAGQVTKTFSDAVGAVKESVSTAFSSIFTDIFGNVSEAASMWSSVVEHMLTVFADPISNLRDAFDEYHDEIHKTVDEESDLNDFGQAVVDIFEGIANIVTAVREAFTELFGSVTGQTIMKISKGFQNFAASFKKATSWVSPFVDKVKGVVNTATEVADKAADAVEKAGSVDDIVRSIIRGDYGNGQARFDKLTDEGLSWQFFQNNVNETLGCLKRYDIEAGTVDESTGKLIKTTDKLTDATDKSAESTAKQVNAFAGSYKRIDEADSRGTKILHTFVGIASALKIVQEAVSGIWNEIVKPLLDKGINTAIDWLLTQTAKLGDNIYQFYANLKANNSIGNFVTSLKSGLIDLKNNIVDIFTTVGKRISSSDEFKTMLKNLETIKNFFNQIKMAIGGFFANIGEQLKKVNITGDDIKKNLIDIMSTIVIKLIDLLNKLFSLITDFKGTMSSLGDTIKAKLKPVADWLSKIFGDTGGKIGTWLKNAGTQLQNLGARLSPLLDPIKRLGSDIKTKVVSAFDELTLKLPDTASGLEKFGAVASGVFQKISEYLGPKLQAAGGFIWNKLQTIWNNSKGVFDKIIGWLKTLYQWIKPALDLVKQFVDSHIDALVAKISKIDIVDGLKSIKGFLESIWEKLKNFKDIFKDFGVLGTLKKNLPTNVLKGLDGTLDKLKGLDLPKLDFSKLNIPSLTSLFGLDSFASSAKEVGQKAADGLKSAFSSEAGANISSVIGLDQLPNLTKEISSKGLLSGIKSFRTSWTKEVKNTKAAVGALNESLGGGSEGLSGTLDTAQNKLKGFFKPVQSMFDTFSTNIKGIGQKISDAWGTSFGFLKTVDWDKTSKTIAGFTMIFTGTKLISALTKFLKGATNVVTGFAGLGKSTIGVVDNFSRILANVGNSAVTIGASLTKAIDSFGGIFTAYQKRLKAKNFKDIALSMSIAVVAITGSLWALSKIPADDLWKSVKALSITMGVLAAVIFAMSKVKVNAKTFAALGAAVAAIVGISMSLVAVMGVVQTLAAMGKDEYITGITRAGIMLAGMAGVAALLSLIIKRSMSLHEAIGFIAIMTGLYQFTKALANVVEQMQVISQMDLRSIKKSFGILAAIIGLLAIVLIASSKLKLSSGVGLAATVLALQKFVEVLEQITKIDLASIEANLGKFIAIFGLLAGLAIVARIAGKGGLGFAAELLALSLTLRSFAKTIQILQSLDSTGMEAAVAAIESFIIIIGLLALMSSKMRLTAGAGMAVELAALSGALLTFSICCAILSLLDPDGLKRAAIAIDSFIICLALFVGISSYAAGIKGAMGVIIGVGVMLAAVAAIFLIMSTLEPDQISTIAGALLEVFAGIDVMLIAIAAMGEHTTGAGLVILMLDSLLAMIAGLFLVVDGLKNPDSVKTTVIAVDGVIAGCVLLCLTIAKLSAMPWSALIGGVLKFISVIGILGGIGAALVLIDQKFAGGAIFETLKTLFSNIGELVGSLIGSFNESVSASFITAAGNIVTAVSMFKLIPDDISTKVKSAVDALNALMGLELKQTGIDALNNVNTFFSDIGDKLFGRKTDQNDDSFSQKLVEMGAALNAFANQIRGIGKHQKDIEAASVAMSGISKIFDNMPKNGDGFSFSGLIFGKTDTGTLGTDLENLGDGLSKFASKVNGIGGNTKDINTAVNLANRLSTVLNSLGRKGGILQKVIGEKKWSSLSVGLAYLGQALATFATNVKDISGKTEDTDAAVNLANQLAPVLNSLGGKGGILQKVIGEKKWSSLSSGLKRFGTALNDFSTSVPDVKDHTEETDAAINLGYDLSGLLKDSTLSGGKWQEVFGEKKWSNISDGLTDFGTALNSFSTSVPDVATNKDNISAAVDAGFLLTPLLDDISASGGKWQEVFGEKEWSTISTGLADFGTAINGFASAVDGIGDYSDDVKESIAIAGDLNTLLQTLKPTQGLIQQVFGDPNVTADDTNNQLGGFSIKLRSFAYAMAKFSTAMATTKHDQFTAARDDLIQLGVGIEKIVAYKDDMVTIGENLPKLGTGISTFIADINGIDTTNTVANASGMLSQLSETIQNGLLEMANTFVNDTSPFTDVGNKIITCIITGASQKIDDGRFVFRDIGTKLASSAIRGSEARINDTTTGYTAVNKPALTKALEKIDSDVKPKFKDCGKGFAKQLIEGCSKQISNSNDGLAATIKPLFQSVITDIENSTYSDFKRLGQFFAQGIVDGIYSKKRDAKDAALALSTAITEATTSRQGLYEASPSHKGFRYGAFYGMGIANGMLSQIPNLISTGLDLASAATDNVAAAMSEASDLITGTLGDASGNPVIAPVLDLSDVRKGTRELDGMFDGYSVGLNDYTSASSISRQMARMASSSSVNNTKTITLSPVVNITNGRYTPADGAAIARDLDKQLGKIL